MIHPEDVLKEWMTAINNRDIERLLGLYDEKAVLIPTFSNRLLNTPEKIRDYFEKLGSRDELSLALHEKTVIVQSINNDTYGLSGIYCWRFALDGELLSFEARFSYFMDLTLPRPIIHHHSSQIPRML
ncbi:MAG: DUF4440 domain-containing protein [Desulfobacteraceae bacterium]|nr:DUF4440 domain-containing protein [Desulfobacteraceae bacterium]